MFETRCRIDSCEASEQFTDTESVADSGWTDTGPSISSGRAEDGSVLWTCYGFCPGHGVEGE